MNTVKSAVWADVLGLLGKEGDRIMLDLILNCGIFVIVDNGKGNLYQLSGESRSAEAVSKLSLVDSFLGTPLTELRALCATKAVNPKQVSAKTKPDHEGNSFHGVSNNTPATIQFVRNRMFYARAALNAKGKVTFGLRHIRRSLTMDCPSTR